MAAGTRFSPGSKNEYGAKSLNSNFKGRMFTAAAGTDTTNDFEITDDCLVDGAVVFAKGAALGDKITFQIVDVNGVMPDGLGGTLPPGTIMGQYVTGWYLNPDSTFQGEFDSSYPAKIPAGLFLRTIYTSVGATDVTFIINYKLHKILW